MDIKKVVRATSKILGVVGLIAIVGLAIGFPLMFLINYVYPPAEFTFWKAVALYVIVKILETSKK